MSKIEQLQQLFRYDLWANKKVEASFNGQLFDETKTCVNLFAHIQAAQQIWYRRIKELSTAEIALWPEKIASDESIEIISDMQLKWQTLLDENAEDLNKKVTYQNSTGREFNTPLAGILHHVIIHGQHHRAQIAMLLRKSGIEPPVTDLIFYLRETDNQ